MIDLKIPSEYGYQIVEGSVKQTGARRIEGFSKQLSKNVWSADADQNYTIYFVIEFNKDIKKFGGWARSYFMGNRHYDSPLPSTIRLLCRI